MPILPGWLLVCIFSLGSFPVVAAIPAQSQVLSGSTANSTANTAADPLGRTTPSGSMLGFLQAAQSGDYGIAAQYLQLSAARRQSEGQQLATKLKIVLDNAFTGRFKNFTQADGVPQEGVPLGRQKLGTMSSGDVEVDLDLVRVSDPNAGKIWLIASDTLSKIPELYEQVQARHVESRLPNVLVKHEFADMPLWQFLALVVALPVAAALGWLILALLEIPLRWWARRLGQLEVANWRSVSGPAWLLGGHSDSSSLRRLPSHSAASTTLLFSNHVGGADRQCDVDSVARRSVGPAPRAQSRPDARTCGHRLAHAVG